MKILITGGAGFIGSNCAAFFAGQGHDIVVFDNLSRGGGVKNLEWLQGRFPITFVKGNVRRYRELEELAAKHGPFDLIIHLAGQVAVTLSVQDPRPDFETNALGSFNVLEMTRNFCPGAVFIYSSTNKVYGALPHEEVVEKKGRYAFKNLGRGVNESENLDFHSPYGCSKGAADQYCIDYARIYGLKTVVLRQSCIYGYRQFGIEDQGWVAWFCIAAARGKPVTFYGDGKQVRDVLFIDDLLALYKLAFERIGSVAGKAFNIGGGPANTLSLIELVAMLEEITGRKIVVARDNWRSGDQRVFIADISAAHACLGWKPAVHPAEGVQKLYGWVKDNLDIFSEAPQSS
jgi:CDP-paratose 2-epimerase